MVKGPFRFVLLVCYVGIVVVVFNLRKFCLVDGRSCEGYIFLVGTQTQSQREAGGGRMVTAQLVQP